MSANGRNPSRKPVSAQDTSAALRALRVAARWSLSPGRWAEVGRVAAAMLRAIADNDGLALRSGLGDLVLLGSESLVLNLALVAKIYFPRIFIPAAVVAAGCFDLVISTTLLIVIVFIYGLANGMLLSVATLALPFLAAIAVMTALGAGTALSAVNVRYRDFRYVIPFLVQFGLYISPVGFSAAVVPEKWRLLYALNPMVGVIDGFRWCLLGAAIDWRVVGVSLAVTAAMLWIGLGQFRRLEKTFADTL